MTERQVGSKSSTSPSGQGPTIEWYEDSYTLRDRDSRTIGSILEVNPDFIVAGSGSWFGSGKSHVHFVPRACVAYEVGMDWHLSISTEELEALGFLLPPVGSPFATHLGQRAEGRDVDASTQGRMRVIRFA